MSTMDSDLLRQAEIAVQHGDWEKSLTLLAEYSVGGGLHEDAIFLRSFILSKIDSRALRSTVIIKRAVADWETDWLDFLIPSLTFADAKSYEQLAENHNFIVIDNHLTSEKVGLFKYICSLGGSIILFHLSDENYSDCTAAYKWCKVVYRNYHSNLLSHNKRISSFALGYKTGFRIEHTDLLTTSRKYTWSFAGDANKATRQKMLQAMRGIAGGYEHLTSSFDAPDALGTSDYAKLMQESVFIPCPKGYCNFDSFRIYEALEAGCIPIVERSRNYDYFFDMFGTYPFPSVTSWEETPALIESLQGRGMTHSVAKHCRIWWARYKASLKTEIASRAGEWPLY